MKGICEYCGVRFEGRSDKRFCSKLCKSNGYYHNNEEERREYSRKYKKDNPQQIIDYELMNKEKRRLQHQEAHLLRSYGISKDIFDGLFILQKKKCLICKKDLESYCVDHDHKTGEFRGLVCKRCNTVMGFVDDDISILNNMIKYLRGERYSTFER